MKKGFTLVELLAVIALLALLALITVPVVDNMLDKQKERIYEQNIETIKDALKNWSNENIPFLPENGEELDITLADLKDEGLIDRNFKNPETKKCYAGNSVFKIKNTNDVYTYQVDELIDGDESECKQITYLYYQGTSVLQSADDPRVTSERPTRYKSYLKYPVADGVLGAPVACHFDDGKEFCLRYGVYTLSRAKLIDYYKGENCTYNSEYGQLGCGNGDSPIGADARIDGKVFTVDKAEDYVCLVWNSNTALCGNIDI